MSRKNTIGVLIIAIAIVSILFTGVAFAAETSYNLTVNGNAFADVDYKMATHNGLPYESESYSQNVVMHDVFAVYTQTLDAGYGLEAETTIEGERKNGLSLFYIDEHLSRHVIGDSQVSENATYTKSHFGSAGFSTQSNSLNYESAALVSSSDIAYGVDAAGSGAMRFLSEEYVASGDIGVNGSWSTSLYDEDVRAVGDYTFAGTFVSAIDDFPAAFEEDEVAEGRLCPFGWGE